MNNVALITGASTGIGKELCHIHAERGGDLVMVARRKDKLEQLKSELENTYAVQVVVVSKDLSLPGTPKEVYDAVKNKNIKVDILINNAGFGGRGKFHERSWDKDHNDPFECD